MVIHAQHAQHQLQRARYQKRHPRARIDARAHGQRVDHEVGAGHLDEHGGDGDGANGFGVVGVEDLGEVLEEGDAHGEKTEAVRPIDGGW